MNSHSQRILYKKVLIVSVLTSLLAGFQNCSPPMHNTGRDLASLADGSAIGPEISLQSPIPTISNFRSLNAVITVRAGENSGVTTVTCQLDAAPESDCSNLQITLTDLTDGDHALKIGAVDANGLVSQDKIYNFRIDATAPNVVVSQAPAAVTGNTTAAIAFAATDALSPVSSILCSRNGGAFVGCTSPVNLTGLSAGVHRLAIKATDAAGNTSGVANVAWTVDLSAPALTITTGPTNFSNSKTAAFGFTGTSGGQPLARFECSIDGGAYATCTSPANFTNLADGNHVFGLRGVNAVGVVSSPMSANWKVDTTAPSVPVLVANVTSPTTQTSASLSFSAMDSGSAVASYSCSIDAGAFAVCTSPKALSGLMEGAHTFQVRATDSAGNVSAAGSFSWTVKLAPVVLDGAVLYAQNCAGCHGQLSNSTRYNRTAAQIQTSINVVGSMNYLRTLTAPQVEAIANVLVKGNNGLANPFTCNSDSSVAVLRRLTKREYSSTIIDLFAGQLALTDIQSELAALQQEFTNAVPSLRVFDSMNPNSLSLPLMMAYNNVAAKAADVITGNAGKMSAIGGTCMQAATVTDACVTTFLDGFGLRASRRPLSAADKTTYLTLYRSGTTPADGMARLVQALLMSPNFLYKLENNGAAVAGRADVLQLDAYEVASRLSYSLLGSMPDQALFDAARAGTLSTAAGIKAQTDRLAASAKAKEGVRAFYSQWLRLDYIPDVQVSAAEADGISVGTFKNEARQEIVDLMDHLIWTQKVNYKGLMTTNLAVPKSANLSRVYGVGTSSTPVPITDPNRAGILTRAGLLALDNVGHSNPIKRGVNLRLHMLCDTLGSPPANVESLASAFDPLSSTRAQVAAKTSAPQCMSCHSRINPMGFAFENFDGFGRFRGQETVSANGQSRVHPIDAVVAPNIVSSNDPTVNGGAAMQAAMSESSVAQSCMVKQWLQYNIGRDAGANDDCAMSSMYEAANKTGGSVLEMLKAYPGTAGFTLKKLGPLN